jgi:hypothetical protein
MKIMKNLMKSVLFLAAIFTAKASFAQVNIGATTATKIVTKATLPKVNAAATTQKVVNGTTDVTSKVAAKTLTKLLKTLLLKQQN